ncbi:MAG: hypothetical protein WKF95_07355 [Rubrobacter sp.]
MLADLILVLPVALLVGVVPGYFWARCLSPGTGWMEQLAWSTALSLSLVPVFAFALARLFGRGVTLPIAIVAPLIVLGLGAAALARFGPAKGDDEPLLVPPTGLPVPALVPVAAAFALVAVSVLLDPQGFWLAGACEGWPTGTCRAAGEAQRFVLPVALLLVGAGAAHFAFSRRGREPDETSGTEFAEPSTTFPGRRFLLPAVLLLVLARGYLGPVLHDWPYIRGLDHYSHAVMTDMMLTQGDTSSYLIYPPGFHVFTACVSRLTGLEPLEVFPVLGPALMVLPALALYVLGTRLWGPIYGVAAAFFSALTGGTYYFFNDAMYPNQVASQFLMVLAIVALIKIYSAPSARNGLLLAAVGSAVVFYHQVSSLYLALLLAVVGLLFVPYLLLRHRRAGLVLLASLALLGLLSVAYAWDTYDLGGELLGLIGGSDAGGATSDIGTVFGSQPAYGLGTLIGAILSQPVAWLGLLGALLLLANPSRRPGAPELLARATLLAWALILFAGSRTPLSGFPQRFGRDLGIPLSLLGALAFVVLLGTLLKRRNSGLGVFVGSLAVILAVSLVGLRGAQGFDQAAGESPHLLMSPGIAEAGAWLAGHNTGGNVMISPQENQVPSRMMLAMGHYSALQSYPQNGIQNPRHMPPSGPEPLRDTLWVMYHPAGDKTQDLLDKHDVRYIVLYKKMPDRPVTPFWRIFKPRPDLYENVFENDAVLILRPRPA